MTRTDTFNGLGRRGFLTVLGGGLAVVALQGCTNDANDRRHRRRPRASRAPTPRTLPRHRDAPLRRDHDRVRAAAGPRARADRLRPADRARGTPDRDRVVPRRLVQPGVPVERGAASAEKPEEVRFYDLEFEKIAALSARPDHDGERRHQKKDYETLTKIAPVVGPPGRLPGQRRALRPAHPAHRTGVGKEAEAQAAVDALDAAVRRRCARTTPTGRGSRPCTPRPTPAPTTCSASRRRARTFLTSVGLHRVPRAVRDRRRRLLQGDQRRGARPRGRPRPGGLVHRRGRHPRRAEEPGRLPARTRSRTATRSGSPTPRPTRSCGRWTGRPS